MSGQVKDAKGEGLPGVNVVLKGTAQGTVTNGEGKYYNYQKGMVPNTRLNITNLNLSTGVHFSDRLKFDGALNLSVQNSPNIPQSSSGPESETYIFQVYGSASWALADMRDYYNGPQNVPGVR